jgi:hypothetical protein
MHEHQDIVVHAYWAPSLGATGDVIRLLQIFVDMKAAAALSAY